VQIDIFVSLQDLNLLHYQMVNGHNFLIGELWPVIVAEPLELVLELRFVFFHIHCFKFSPTWNPCYWCPYPK